ncbi:MAG: hypothetical protein ACKO5K_12505 [Armatimonadota bacterium]
MTLPAGIPEGLLFAVLAGGVALVVRSVRRRRQFVAAAPVDELPDLTTESRLRMRVRRLWRDSGSGMPMVEAEHRGRRLVFCAVDQGSASAGWSAAIGKERDVAVYGLATLAPGGAEAMRDRIRNADKLQMGADFSALVHEGQHPNDYVVIGRALDRRDAAWGEMSLDVWRVRCAIGSEDFLVLDLAVPAGGEGVPPEGGMVHGSARLFGYGVD